MQVACIDRCDVRALHAIPSLVRDTQTVPPVGAPAMYPSMHVSLGRRTPRPRLPDMADGEAVAAMADDIRQPRPAGIYEHYCEHPGCSAWGGWGYSRGKATIWFCGEHREDGELVAR